MDLNDSSGSSKKYTRKREKSKFVASEEKLEKKNNTIDISNENITENTNENYYTITQNSTNKNEKVNYE